MVWGVMLLGFMGCEWWKVSSSLGCVLMLLAELLTHQPVLPKALGAPGWGSGVGLRWRRSFTSAQGGAGSEDGASGASQGCGMSLRSQRGVVGFS